MQKNINSLEVPETSLVIITTEKVDNYYYNINMKKELEEIRRDHFYKSTYFVGIE